MLHTVIFALKLTGYILSAFLCAALLFILAIFFAPIKYEVRIFSKNTEDTAKINLNFSWLIHLISGRFTREGKNSEWKIRIGWKQLPSEKKEEIKDSKKSKTPPKKKEKGNDDGVQQKEKEVREKKEEGEKRKSLKDKSKEKAEQICDIIKSLKDKTEDVRNFLSDDVHKAAFFKLLKEAKIFLSRAKPEKLRGRLCFGFEDPSDTGKIFGCISMLYPLLGGEFEAIPDFNEKRMEADLAARGRFRAIYAAALALKLTADKNIRATLRHIRKAAEKVRK